MLISVAVLATLIAPKSPQVYLDFSKIKPVPYRARFATRYVYSGVSSKGEDWSGAEEETFEVTKFIRPYGYSVFKSLTLTWKEIGLSPALKRSARSHPDRVGTVTTTEYTDKGLLVSSSSKTATDYYYAYPKGKIKVGANWPGFINYHGQDYPAKCTLTAFMKVMGEPCAEVTMNGNIKYLAKGGSFSLTVTHRNWFSTINGMSIKSESKKLYDLNGKQSYTVVFNHRI